MKARGYRELTEIEASAYDKFMPPRVGVTGGIISAIKRLVAHLASITI